MFLSLIKSSIISFVLVLSEIGDIEETVDNFAVIGSAERFALGVLKTLENDNMFTWEKIQKALEIAEKFDCSVKGPMHLDILINP
jgi:ATP-dependent protease HslVU (ClpYQ) peptidase subunit